MSQATMTRPAEKNGRMTRTKREPILRVVPRPGDIHANGHIFGGWVLSQMDIAAGIVASYRAQGPVATVAIEAMEFIATIRSEERRVGKEWFSQWRSRWKPYTYKKNSKNKINNTLH